MARSKAGDEGMSGFAGAVRSARQQVTEAIGRVPGAPAARGVSAKSREEELADELG